MADRLYRSRTDRPIAGVAGGLAAWMGLDPSLVRVAWVVLAVVSGGLFLLVYIVMMIVVPLAPEGWQPRAPYDRYQGPPNGWAPGAAPTAAGPASDPTQPPPASWPEAQQGQQGQPGQYWSQPPQSAPLDGGRAGLVAGIFLIALGAWFLVDDYIHIDWAVAWPVIVILAGAALVLGAARRR